MDFSEDHSKFLLSKEWLVKVDNGASTPYFIKFFSSTVDISCCILVTDAKSVWVEVMSSSQFARRWRRCNNVSPIFLSEMEEDAWRITMLELLSKAHTLGGITDLSFAVSESHYADLAFELESSFIWRWETCFLGHRRSAEIISKHLIFPLISLNYLAFSSADVVAELPDADVEKAVDKVGRTARRTLDTHIRNAMSKPRVATTLRRMTAMFNFIPDLPPVISIAEKPDLQIDVQVLRTQTRSDVEIEPRVTSPLPRVSKELGKPSLNPCGVRYPLQDVLLDEEMSLDGPGGITNPIHADSATESEGEEYDFPDKDKLSEGPSARPSSAAFRGPPNRDSVIFSRDPPPQPSTSRLNSSKDLPSDSESPPARSAKRPKKQVVSSSDDNSEEERKRRVAQLKSGAGGVKRGTRQPIKRGGKRF